MSLNVTDAEVRDHDKLLQTYRDKRTRCVHCEQLIMDWDTARPLACLHVLCSEECLIANKIDDLYDCPTCHLSVDANGLETWRSIGLAIFRNEAFLTCTHCFKKVPAIYWCAQCPDSLCQPCRESHLTFVRTAKHTLTLFDPNRIPDPKNLEVVCEKHNEKIVKYCMTCNEVVCSSPSCCRPHANHELKIIKDFVKEFRTKIQKGAQNMSGFLAQTVSSMDSIKEVNDETLKTLDPQSNSGILNLFGAEFNRIVDLVAQSEVLLKERESLKNFKLNSLRSRVNQFLHVIGDTTGISNEIITQNYRILNEHFEEIEKGIAVCSAVNDDTDTIIDDYLPAFQQVTDQLEMLIQVFSGERSQGIPIMTRLNSPFNSGIHYSLLAATAQNGEETEHTSMAGFSENAAKVTATPKVSKSQKDVEIMEDTRSESEEDERSRGQSRGKKAEKKITRATGETTAAEATNQSHPFKRSPSEQSDTFSHETDRPHSRKRKDESPPERRTTSVECLSQILNPDADVKETASQRSSKSPVCVQQVGTSSPEMEKGKDERSESGRDVGGPSTSRSQSPNRRKNRRRWSQGNDKPLKSRKKTKPSTPLPTIMATSTVDTYASSDDMNDIAGSRSGSRDESTLPIKKRRLDESAKNMRTSMKKPSTNSPHESAVLSKPNASSKKKGRDIAEVSNYQNVFLLEGVEIKRVIAGPFPNARNASLYDKLEPEEQLLVDNVVLGRFYPTLSLFEIKNEELRSLYNYKEPHLVCFVCPHLDTKVEKVKDNPFYIFSKKCAFDRHYENKHVKPVKCDFCSVCFNDRRHKKSHEESKHRDEMSLRTHAKTNK